MTVPQVGARSANAGATLNVWTPGPIDPMA